MVSTIGGLNAFLLIFEMIMVGGLNAFGLIFEMITVGGLNVLVLSIRGGYGLLSATKCQGGLKKG